MTPWKRSLWIIFAIMFFAAFALPGCDCGDDDDDDDSTPADDDDDDDDDDDNDDNDTVDVSELIQEGKDWLAFPEGDRARLSFLQALELDPDNTEAMYGMVLSNTVHATDVLSIVVDYVMSLLDYGGPVKGEPDSDDLLDGIIQLVLDGLLRDRTDELIVYADQVLADDGSFSHDGIPIFIHYEQVAELATEFDKSEIFATTAFSKIFAGLIYHLYAINLDFDLSHAVRLIDLDFDQMTTTEIVSAVTEILLYILTDPGFPDFLTIPEEGGVVFQEAGMEVADGLNAWLATFGAIQYETDPQEDDVLSYVDTDQDGHYTPGEPYVIPHYGQLDETGMEWVAALNAIVEGLRNSMYDYTEKDIDPDNPNPFQVALLKDVFRLLGLPVFIVPNITIDMGARYVDPAGSGLKDTLITILRILDFALPDYHW